MTVQWNRDVPAAANTFKKCFVRGKYKMKIQIFPYICSRIASRVIARFHWKGFFFKIIICLAFLEGAERMQVSVQLFQPVNI